MREKLEAIRSEYIAAARTPSAREQINTILDRLEQVDLGPQSVSMLDSVECISTSTIACNLREWLQQADEELSKEKSDLFLDKWLDISDNVNSLERLVQNIDDFAMSDDVPAELYPQIAQKEFLKKDIPHVGYLKEMGRKKLKGELWEMFNFIFGNALSFSLYHKWGKVEFAADDSQMGWDLKGQMSNGQTILFQSKFVAPGSQLYNGQANKLETLFGEAASDPAVAKVILFTSARKVPGAKNEPISGRYRRWTYDRADGSKSKFEILDFNAIDELIEVDVEVADIFWQHVRNQFENAVVR
jgi:hypothetical protein